jgi:hypothetical protein
LVPGIQEDFDSRLELVFLAKWVEVLANTEEKEAGVDNKPALKLLDWFQALIQSDNEDAGQVTLDTKETIERSKTMRQLRPVNNTWMTVWLKQWGF